jgi:hypothetical protein
MHLTCSSYMKDHVRRSDCLLAYSEPHKHCSRGDFRSAAKTRFSHVTAAPAGRWQYVRACSDAQRQYL